MVKKDMFVRSNWPNCVFPKNAVVYVLGRKRLFSPSLDRLGRQIYMWASIL